MNMGRLVFGLSIILITLGCATKAVLNSADDVAGEWQGQVRVGVMAIGGETTGVVLETNDGLSFELAISDKNLLDSLMDGWEIRVGGVLTSVNGLERPSRKIIKVKNIIVIKESVNW